MTEDRTNINNLLKNKLAKFSQRKEFLSIPTEEKKIMIGFILEEIDLNYDEILALRNKENKNYFSEVEKYIKNKISILKLKEIKINKRYEIISIILPFSLFAIWIGILLSGAYIAFIGFFISSVVVLLGIGYLYTKLQPYLYTNSKSTKMLHYFSNQKITQHIDHENIFNQGYSHNTCKWLSFLQKAVETTNKTLCEPRYSF